MFSIFCVIVQILVSTKFKHICSLTCTFIHAHILISHSSQVKSQVTGRKGRKEDSDLPTCPPHLCAREDHGTVPPSSCAKAH